MSTGFNWQAWWKDHGYDPTKSMLLDGRYAIAGYDDEAEYQAAEEAFQAEMERQNTEPFNPMVEFDRLDRGDLTDQERRYKGAFDAVMEPTVGFSRQEAADFCERNALIDKEPLKPFFLMWLLMEPWDT